MFLLTFSWLFWVWFCSYFLSFVFTCCVSPFNICCKADSVVLNSLNLCLFTKLLISPLILNEIFAGYSNRGCRFFSLRTKYILTFPFGLQCFCWRSTVNHMGFPLYVTCFSLASFNILSLYLISVSLINVSQCVSPWV